MKLFNGNDIVWKAYDEGQKAYKQYLSDNNKPGNPYPQHSDEWCSWNKGWNS